MSYEDIVLNCRECGQEFPFTAGEQEFYASKGLLNQPQRCVACRAVRRRERSAAGPREMHTVQCAACGGEAQVPFVPKYDRPVYCSSCFEKVRAEGQPV